MTIRLLCPELTNGQLKAIERLISEAVIGKDELPKELQGIKFIGRPDGQRDSFRAEQRKALTALLWGAELTPPTGRKV